MGELRINRFWSIVTTVVVVFAAVKWLIPAVSRQLTGLPFPLTVPGALVFIYMVLALIALFLLVTFSDEHMEEFLQPIRKFLLGGYGKIPLTAGLIILPLLIGWQVYRTALPSVELPSSLRIQHPSSNFPKDFEKLKNPAADPSVAEVAAFIEEAQANDVMLIQQVQADAEAWWDENSDAHPLAFIPTEPMKKFLAVIGAGNVDEETARAALIEKNLFEGRALYAMNCRPCHGDSVGGDGPMADAFRLRPINFTDNGTIETIVEGYTFWRVAKGGRGLPTGATPWDSAMPRWELNLTEEERWKIILAEYDLAQKTPRIPEGQE